jgi:hypothetical protein
VSDPSFARRAECSECAELEAKGRAPELRLTSGSAYLFSLVNHVIAAHELPGVPPELLEPEAFHGNELRRMYTLRWRVQAMLGIVWDGPGHPLRYADMPPMIFPRDRGNRSPRRRWP